MSHNFIKSICLSVLILFSGKLIAQELTIQHFESELLKQTNQLGKQRYESNKLIADSAFYLLTQALLIEGSFDYSFDTIKSIGSIYSPDKKIRILTWNIPINYDKHEYFGLIQYYSRSEKKYLLDTLKTPFNPTEPMSPDNWPGGLYYEIVETKHAGQKYYTLLGFHLNSILSNKKVVDVLAIDKFDELYFAKNLIEHENKLHTRLEFEYSENSIMSLKYNDDKKMIVFDHLSPRKPSLTGKHEFYGPDLSYDGLKFEKGIWVHYPKIEVTN